MKRMYALLLVFLLGSSAGAEVVIGTWNVRILSTGSRTDEELSQIADRIIPLDVLALQEVRDPEVVDRLVALLAARGHRYEAVVSEQVGRETSERYAFLWRAGAVVSTYPAWLWSDSDDEFIREPFVGHFRAGAFDFTLITIHVIFGDRVAQRRAEAEALARVVHLVQLIEEEEDDVLVAGDFNLEPDDEGLSWVRDWGWESLLDGSEPTTISDSATYDTIWRCAETTEWTGAVGVDRFDETVFAGDDEAASLAVSDHRPVWAKFATHGPDDDGYGITSIEQASWGSTKRAILFGF